MHITHNYFYLRVRNTLTRQIIMICKTYLYVIANLPSFSSTNNYQENGNVNTFMNQVVFVYCV